METHPLRGQFLRTYSNIPLGIRADICGVLAKEGPFTWNVAYLEVEQNTAKGSEILDYMNSLQLI